MHTVTETDINKTLVSVVMATYNGERFIAEQLESILTQTYSNLEIIIVDDRSTDQSYTILESYAAKDTRIRLFRNEQNLGYVKNFEKGLSLAGGVYIAPSDQDDIWLPHKITTLVNHINDNTIVYSDSVLIDEEGQFIGKKLSDIKQLGDFRDCLSFLVGNAAAGHAMLIKTELIQQAIPLAPMIPHDQWLGFVATFHNGLKFIDTPLVYYRQHHNSTFGAVKVKETGSTLKKRKKQEQKNLSIIRERVRLMYEKCPPNKQEEKDIFRRCYKYYASFSLSNNFNRMCLFFAYNKRIMAYKRRNIIRRWMYCIKLFFTIQ